nr:IS3 family transposase [Lactiplantibacillus carotarum]
MLAGEGIIHSIVRELLATIVRWKIFGVNLRLRSWPSSNHSLRLSLLTLSYINWHNTERRQLTLNGMTPEEYRNHAV